MIRKQKQANNQSAAGFTLIEVLVSLVVMTVGMLGIAVLYVEGLRLNRTSMYRATAVSLAADMAERIRANQDVTADYENAGPGQPGDCDVGPPCTPAELAGDDWATWRNVLNDSLPTGYEATIGEVQAGPLRRFDINLKWAEVGSPDLVSYTLSIQL